MSLQNRCHVPIARLKSAQATVGNIPTHPILSTAIPCSGHVVFPNAPSNMVRHAHAMLLAACLTVSAMPSPRHPMTRKACRHLTLRLSRSPSTKIDRSIGSPSCPTFIMTSEPFGRFLPSLLTAKIGNPPLRFLPAWERWWRLIRTTPLISATTRHLQGSIID